MRLKLLFFYLAFMCFCLCSRAETYIVIAGVSDYQHISDLRLPEKDALAVAELYKTRTENVITITGKYATKKNIINALSSQFARAKANDQIVFFFSGHGFPGGICPYDIKRDGNEITYKEILSIFKRSKAKTKIIFADACFAGGLRSSNNASTTASNEIKNANVMLFLSSRAYEASIENAFMANGFFTTFLLRGLKGGADNDKNRIITAKELFWFVYNGVKEKSHDKQHPVMWGKFDDNFTVIKW